MGRDLVGLPAGGAGPLTGSGEGRGALVAAWRAAVAAVHGETLLARHARLVGNLWCVERGDRRVMLPLPGRGEPGRVRAIGAGKAAAALARGLEQALGDHLDDGLVAVKHGHLLPLSRIALVEGGHPVPDAASEAAAARLLEFIGRPAPDDRYVVLLTGGASAVLEAPAPGLVLDDTLRVTQRLLASGAPIDEVNLVRRHLSAIKGGRLAARLAPARFVTLAISDVPGDAPATIGSGPTVADASTPREALAVLLRYGATAEWPLRVLRHLQAEASASSPVGASGEPGGALAGDAGFLVLGTLRDAMDAAAGALRDRGWSVQDLGRCLDGDVARGAADFARRLHALRQGLPSSAAPVALLAGGEPTVRLQGAGMGGRCQEFALRVAREIDGLEGVVLLAAGTDGTDGPTAHGGAFADGGTWGRARRAGLEPARRLAANDSQPVLAASGDLFTTVPTGTNVADLVMAVVG
jgi:glycerate-2-kinase